jgi:anti-sigma regulatory factor (Ser/Thr protein kinase)
MGGETFDIGVCVTSTMAAARQNLRDRLRAWGCRNVDDAVLVFSELVTNAIEHSASAPTTVIRHEPPDVRIEVFDVSHSRHPQLRHDTRPGGFGLRIVSQLSKGWGWEPTSTGKVVWSNVPCDRRLTDER